MQNHPTGARSGGFEIVQPAIELAQMESQVERPMRVCFLIDRLGVAGIECQLLFLLRRLDRSKVEPYLCLLDGSDKQLHSLEPEHCPVIRLGVRSLLRFSTFRKALQFARFIRRERIDVLHAFLPDSLYFGAVSGKLAGVRVVRFRVDLGYWMKRTDRWLLRLLRPMIDATVANCEACRQVTIAQEWASPGSIAIIPNGIDVDKFPESFAAKVRDESTGEWRVGAVANLRPVKSLDLFVRAAAALRSSHPEVRFQVAGEGESRPELESLIRELGLQDRVDLLGSVSDVPAFLRTLDVAVLCSQSEGSPNAIMEYMAAARPIVATAVGGNSELLEAGKHGLLVLPGNADQLAVAIDRLLTDRAFALRLGASARQRALTEFDMHIQARRYEGFYRALIHGKRPLLRGGALDATRSA